MVPYAGTVISFHNFLMPCAFEFSVGKKITYHAHRSKFKAIWPEKCFLKRAQEQRLHFLLPYFDQWVEKRESSRRSTSHKRLTLEALNFASIITLWSNKYYCFYHGNKFGSDGVVGVGCLPKVAKVPGYDSRCFSVFILNFLNSVTPTLNVGLFFSCLFPLLLFFFSLSLLLSRQLKRIFLVFSGP